MAPPPPPSVRYTRRHVQKTLFKRFHPRSSVDSFAGLIFEFLDEDKIGVIDFWKFYQVIIVTETCDSDRVSRNYIILLLKLI